MNLPGRPNEDRRVIACLSTRTSCWKLDRSKTDIDQTILPDLTTGEMVGSSRPVWRTVLTLWLVASVGVLLVCLHWWKKRKGQPLLAPSHLPVAR